MIIILQQVLFSFILFIPLQVAFQKSGCRALLNQRVSLSFKRYVAKNGRDAEHQIQHSVPEHVLIFSASRSSGPGGQNVNKVNSKIELRGIQYRLSMFYSILFLNFTWISSSCRQFRLWMQHGYLKRLEIE